MRVGVAHLAGAHPLRLHPRSQFDPRAALGVVAYERLGLEGKRLVGFRVGSVREATKPSFRDSRREWANFKHLKQPAARLGRLSRASPREKNLRKTWSGCLTNRPFLVHSNAAVMRIERRPLATTHRSTQHLATWRNFAHSDCGCDLSSGIWSLLLRIRTEGDTMSRIFRRLIVVGFIWQLTAAAAQAQAPPDGRLAWPRGTIVKRRHRSPELVAATAA